MNGRPLVDPRRGPDTFEARHHRNDDADDPITVDFRDVRPATACLSRVNGRSRKLRLLRALSQEHQLADRPGIRVCAQR